MNDGKKVVQLHGLLFVLRMDKYGLLSVVHGLIKINQYIIPAVGIIQPFLFLEKPCAC